MIRNIKYTLVILAIFSVSFYATTAILDAVCHRMGYYDGAE